MLEKRRSYRSTYNNFKINNIISSFSNLSNIVENVVLIRVRGYLLAAIRTFKVAVDEPD